MIRGLESGQLNPNLSNFTLQLAQACSKTRFKPCTCHSKSKKSLQYRLAMFQGNLCPLHLDEEEEK